MKIGKLLIAMHLVFMTPTLSFAANPGGNDCLSLHAIKSILEISRDPLTSSLFPSHKMYAREAVLVYRSFTAPVLRRDLPFLIFNLNLKKTGNSELKAKLNSFMRSDVKDLDDGAAIWMQLNELALQVEEQQRQLRCLE